MLGMGWDANASKLAKERAPLAIGKESFVECIVFATEDSEVATQTVSLNILYWFAHAFISKSNINFLRLVSPSLLGNVNSEDWITEVARTAEERLW
jgi:hypothetical protein